MAKNSNVNCNLQADHVSGRIVKVQGMDSVQEGHNRCASKEEPQHAIENDKTHHIAAHKLGALTRFDS